MNMYTVLECAMKLKKIQNLSSPLKSKTNLLNDEMGTYLANFFIYNMRFYIYNHQMIIKLIINENINLEIKTLCDVMKIQSVIIPL